jgi:hypothetical protein
MSSCVELENIGLRYTWALGLGVLGMMHICIYRRFKAKIQCYRHVELTYFLRVNET